MARQYFSGRDASTKPARRSNPAILGADVMPTVKRGAGFFIAEALNQKLVSPIVKRVFVPSNANNVVAKLVDALGTLVGGVIAKDVAKAIGDQQDGRLFFEGAAVGAGAKTVAAIIPGMSLNANLPNFSFFPSPVPAAPAVAAPAPVAALASPNGAATITGDSRGTTAGSVRIIGI